MNLVLTKPLDTERLLLRPAAPDDAEAMYRNWAGDPRVTTYMTWPTHASADISRRIIADWIAADEKAEGGFANWMIVPKSLGEPIGSIGAVVRDAKAGRVEVGYCLGSRWWRQGIMSEAFAAVIRYLFEEVGANRVEARHDLNNPNSGKVMAHCGLKREAVLEQYGWNNQGVCDEAMYRLLASEYHEKR